MYKNYNLNLSIYGPFAGNLSESDNLIITIIKEFKKYKKLPLDYGANITLEKNLPVGSGIGGGSSDAATALLVFCQLWNIEFTLEELQKFSLPLGADIPVCLVKKASFVQGVGEIKHIYKNFPKLHAVLVNPLISVSTKEIFQKGFSQYSEKQLHPESFSDENELVDYIENQKNDLTKNTLEIEDTVADCLKELKNSSDNILARMSGSGATCFALFKNMEHATKAERSLKEKRPNWWVKAVSLS